jgi:regulatory protein
VNLSDKVKAYAFFLLKFRPRSEDEIRARLKKKRFDAKIIEETLSFLKEKGFIDDAYFARVWVESRIRKPLGIRRLKQELKLKGIDSGIIESQISEIKKSYPEDKIVSRLVEEKLDRLKGIDPQKAKKRVYSWLLRRGFSPEIIITAISNYKP